MLPKQPISPNEAHVLIIEDHIHSAALFGRMLDFAGVRRHEQNASGREALKRADKMSRLDLILMDLNLPDQSGYEILNKLRQNPRLVDTCVIAVTADTNTATMEKARQAGFDGFLGKPVDPDRFSNLLTDILNGEAIWDLGDVRW